MTELEMLCEEYYVGEFGDARLKKNGAQLLGRMVERRSACLRRLSNTRAEEMRFGRFLSNPNVTRQEIAREANQKTAALAAGLHVLALHDSSELNCQAHAGRTGGLGKVGNGKDVGVFIHPMLVIDADSSACLGLAHQQAWVRTKAAGDRTKLPIEEKESYRWLESAHAGKRCLRQAKMVTIVADRESDIYEEWDRIPDDRTHILTRVCRDRRLSNGHSLYAWLEAQPIMGCYRLPVKARPAKANYGGQQQGKRSAHSAQMEIRYGAVEIMRPTNCKDKAAKHCIQLWCVEVRERAESVLGNEEPVHWRLLTTHHIDSVEQALQLVDWYGERWQIEQLFRTIKKQGLETESSQLEDGERLIKLAVMATQAAVCTLQLTRAREGNTERPATDVFDPEEVEVMKKLQPQLEGRTAKQKNPHPQGRLSWTAWTIARLGGWKGYPSEAKPGPITMLRGQQRFASIVCGWKLANLCAQHSPPAGEGSPPRAGVRVCDPMACLNKANFYNTFRSIT